MLKYAVIIFAVFSAYTLFIVNGCSFPKVKENLTYIYHCVDYSMGLCTGFLPGAVFNFFVKNPSVEAATVFDNILLFTAFAGAAALLAKWLINLSDDEFGTKKKLLSFFVIGSFTFAAFSSVLGMLDSYWLFFSHFTASRLFRSAQHSVQRNTPRPCGIFRLLSAQKLSLHRKKVQQQKEKRRYCIA